MIKKLILGLLGLILVVGLGLYLLGSNIDGIVKTSIEKYGVLATKAPTSLDNVSISLRDGKASLVGFNLGNPQGFTAPSAMKFSLVSIQIDPEKITQGGPIVIKEIIIDAPEVTYEVLKDGTSNLQTIQKNIQAFAASLSPNKGLGDKPGDQVANDKAERKVIVEHLTISNGQIKLSHELLAGKELPNAKLPTIEMQNIGKEDMGVTGAKLAEILLEKITTKAIEVGQANLVGQLRDQGIESLKGAVEQSEIGKAIGGFLNK